MKRKSIIILCALSMLIVTNAYSQTRKSKKIENKIELTNQLDTVSYILGTDVFNNFSRMEIDINLDKFIEGLKAASTKSDTLLTPEQTQEIMMKWQVAQQAKQAAIAKEKSDANKKIGKEFLENNKNKPGVKTTTSGLQYKVLNAGEGVSPTATETVKVHYTGTLIDGTKFDSSRDRGEPAQFPLNRVIPGWTEGLQLMKPGAHFIFYIPSELGYGENKMGNIPESSLLIFDVELLEVVK